MRTQITMAVATFTYWLMAGVAWAQEDPEGPIITPPDTQEGGILPRPSDGRAPQTPGDPGGWQQLLLLAVILISVIVIVLLVRRQVTQAKRLATLDLGAHQPAEPDSVDR